jgi:hypothetical protein
MANYEPHIVKRISLTSQFQVAFPAVPSCAVCKTPEWPAAMLHTLALPIGHKPASAGSLLIARELGLQTFGKRLSRG